MFGSLENCPNHCYDPVQASSAYSALAGILAGFAFAAIFLLLDRYAKRSVETSTETEDVYVAQALGVFVTAFIGLLISTFLFAALGGEQGVYERSAALVYLAGLAFAPAIAQLFLGLVLLTRAQAQPVIRSVMNVVVGGVVPLVTLLFLSVTAVDGIALDLPDGEGWTRWYGTAHYILLGIGVAGISLILWRPQRVFELLGLEGMSTIRPSNWIAFGGLALTLFAAVATAIVGERPPNAGMAAVIYVGMDAIVLVGILVLALVVANPQADAAAAVEPAATQLSSEGSFPES